MSNAWNTNVFRVYCSHPIRGKKGPAATDEDIRKNNEWACNLAVELRAYLYEWEKMHGLPKVHLYVPGEHDEFVSLAYREGILTEDQILKVDKMLLSQCGLMLMFGNYISRGMEVELEHACMKEIPVFKFSQLTPGVANELYHTLSFITQGELND